MKVRINPTDDAPGAVGRWRLTDRLAAKRKVNFPQLTAILRGLAFSAFGKMSVITPFVNCALIFV